MNDFQDTLKRLLEADDVGDSTAAPGLEPIGAPDKFDIGHHDKQMGKSTDAGEVLKKHLEAQAFEFKKLKAVYDELVQVMGEMGQYGIEGKDFMKGMKPMQRPVQGQVSDPSQVAAMANPRQHFQTDDL